MAPKEHVTYMNANLSIDISDRHANHVLRVFHDLSAYGWIATRFPGDATVRKNQQLFELHAPNRGIQIRLSTYKVSGRGEAHRLHQQRIEITTTLGSGLPRLRNWADVILGYDPERDAYVGLDPRRLALGGKTHNASTSVDPAALADASNSRILIRPHETKSLKLEYQAIFRPQRLGEYLFNYEAIHAGRYGGDGLLSGPLRRTGNRAQLTLSAKECRGNSLVLSHSSASVARKRKISKRDIEAFENEDADRFKDLSPKELEKIRAKCQEVGDGGEAYVYRSEQKRLQKAGRGDLSAKIEWVSQKAVGRGYDIKSFDSDGTPRHIEVKATIGSGRTFFMSGHEWKVASRFRKSYWVYRVVNALENPKISILLQNPVEAERKKVILRVADGWRITLLK